jgi:uncharacterized integral membrane protein
MNPEEQPAGAEEQRGFGKTEAKWLAAGIIAILFGVFIAENSKDVPVHFVFFTAKIRLVWVFLICGIFGAVVDRLLQHRGILSKRRRQRQ